MKRAQPIARPTGLGSEKADEHARQVAERINTLASEPQVRGRLLTNVKLEADGAAKKVPHGLGSVPRGWSIARTRYQGREFYDSGNQTITSSGTIALTHRLGGKPLHVALALACVGAEDGYAVGDELWILTQHSTGERGVTVSATSSGLLVAYGSAAAVFEVQPAAGGAVVSLTNSNFRLVVRARRERHVLETGRDANNLSIICPGAVAGDSLDLWVY